MTFNLTHSPIDFIKAAKANLLKSETENCLILGLLDRLKDNTHLFGTEDPNFITITHEEKDYYAIQTPPHNFLLSSPFPEQLLTPLLTYLTDRNIPVPGVTGETLLAKTFSNKYVTLSKKKAEVSMNQKIYELSTVAKEYLDLGSFEFRNAEIDELNLILQWMYEFCTEAVPGNENLEKEAFDLNQRENFKAAILKKQFYLLLESGVAKTMARSAGETENTQMINGVYTPKPERKRGLATICVASLSQKILDSGKEKCILFTDISNSTSNSIYQKIGYQEISESIMIKFLD